MRGSDRGRAAAIALIATMIVSTTLPVVAAGPETLPPLSEEDLGDPVVRDDLDLSDDGWRLATRNGSTVLEVDDLPSAETAGFGFRVDAVRYVSIAVEPSFPDHCDIPTLQVDFSEDGEPVVEREVDEPATLSFRIDPGADRLDWALRAGCSGTDAAVRLLGPVNQHAPSLEPFGIDFIRLCSLDALHLEVTHLAPIDLEEVRVSVGGEEQEAAEVVSSEPLDGLLTRSRIRVPVGDVPDGEIPIQVEVADATGLVDELTHTLNVDLRSSWRSFYVGDLYRDDYVYDPTPTAQLRAMGCDDRQPTDTWFVVDGERRAGSTISLSSRSVEILGLLEITTPWVVSSIYSYPDALTYRSRHTVEGHATFADGSSFERSESFREGLDEMTVTLDRGTGVGSSLARIDAVSDADLEETAYQVQMPGELETPYSATVPTDTRDRTVEVPAGSARAKLHAYYAPHLLEEVETPYGGMSTGLVAPTGDANWAAWYMDDASLTVETERADGSLLSSRSYPSLGQVVAAAVRSDLSPSAPDPGLDL